MQSSWTYAPANTPPPSALVPTTFQLSARWLNTNPSPVLGGP